MQPQPPASVRIGYVLGLLDYLQPLKLDARDIIDPSMGLDPGSVSLNERIPLQHWATLLNRAIALTGDTDLPLRVAEQLQPKHWGVFAYTAMTSQTLGEVVAILERYERLIDEANDSRLQIAGDRALLQWLPRDTPVIPAFMQISLASWAVFARRYTERTDLVADVDFTFPAPADTSTYQRIFGGRIRFGQPVTQLSFPLAYLQLPITHHDADVHRVLVSQVRAQLAALDADLTPRAQVRRVIARQLSGGATSLESVAKALGMVPRTLQYQLESEGTSFRRVLDDIRHELACLYLQDTAMSLLDVAFLLGYSEQSPFNKAFKRWQGETPGEYRRRVAP